MKVLPDGRKIKCCYECDYSIEEVIPVMDLTDTIIVEEEYLYSCEKLDMDIENLGEFLQDCPLEDAEGDEE